MLELMDKWPTTPTPRMESAGVGGGRRSAKQQSSDFDFAALLEEAESAQAPPMRSKASAPKNDDSAAEAAAKRESSEVEDEQIQKEAARTEEGKETAEAEAEAAAKKQMEGDVEPLTQAVAVVQETGKAIRIDAESGVEVEEDPSFDLEDIAWNEGMERMREEEGDSEGQMDEEMTDDVPLQPAAVQEDGMVAEGPTVLDLLNANELLDPNLVVEKAPQQVIERVQQAMSTGGAPILEEMAETVLPQVIRGLATLVRNGAAEMRLQLQPADLGEIELRVRTAEGVVRGEMMVQHPEIKQLLENELGRLRAALAEQGLELDGFDVNVERDTQFADTGDSQSRSGDGRSARNNGNPMTEPTPAAAAPTRVSLGNHAVDVTI